uniref:Uncharacterized protein n=1 Tax=Rhizobium leguminosarum bv. viciae TaxID=387 RepID=A0A0U3HZJ9_RHILV|nr:hypothetical protein [Rhizobium leguminosarum bv. viciae]
MSSICITPSEYVIRVGGGNYDASGAIIGNWIVFIGNGGFAPVFSPFSPYPKVPRS